MSDCIAEPCGRWRESPSASWCVSQWGRKRDWDKKPDLPVLPLRKWSQVHLHKLMCLAKHGAAFETVSLTAAVQLGFFAFLALFQQLTALCAPLILGTICNQIKSLLM